MQWLRPNRLPELKLCGATDTFYIISHSREHYISLSPYETDLKRPNPGSHLRPNVRRSIPMRFGFNYEYVHSPNLSHLRCRRLFQPFVDVHSRFDDLYLCRSASNISKAKLWRLGAGALPCFLCGLSSR